LERLEASKVLEEYCNAQVKLLESSLSQPSPTQSNFPWEGVFLVLGLVLVVGVYYYLTLEVPRPTELATLAPNTLSSISGVEQLVSLQYAPGVVSRVYQHAERLLQLALHSHGLPPSQLIEEANTIYGHLGQEYVQVAPLISNLTSSWSGASEVLFTTPVNFIVNSAGVNQTLSAYVQTVSEATEVYGQIMSGAFQPPHP